MIIGSTASSKYGVLPPRYDLYDGALVGLDFEEGVYFMNGGQRQLSALLTHTENVSGGQLVVDWNTDSFASKLTPEAMAYIPAQGFTVYAEFTPIEFYYNYSYYNAPVIGIGADIGWNNHMYWGLWVGSNSEQITGSGEEWYNYPNGNPWYPDRSLQVSSGGASGVKRRIAVTNTLAAHKLSVGGSGVVASTAYTRLDFPIQYVTFGDDYWSDYPGSNMRIHRVLFYPAKPDADLPQMTSIGRPGVPPPYIEAVGAGAAHAIGEAVYPAVGIARGRGNAIAATGTVTALANLQPIHYEYLEGSYLATRTISGVSLGDQSLSRRIFVVVSYDHNGYPGVNSITIGGVTATIHANVANGGWYVGVIIASAVVPFGSTADVVINFPGYWLGGWYQGYVQIYRATGLAGAPLDTVTSNTGTYTSVHTLTDIETVPNGVVVVAMTSNNQSNLTVAYNGRDSVAQDINVLDYARYMAMSIRTSETASTNDLTFTFAGNGEGVAAAVSFGPA